MSGGASGKLRRLGGLLVDLGNASPADACRYSSELMERLAPRVAIHVSWSGPSEATLPGGVQRSSGPGSLALARAAQAAAGEGDLVVLLAPLLPDSAALQGLVAAFELDERAGFAQPRFGNGSGEGVWVLPGGEPNSTGILPRGALSLLPDTYVIAERLAACLAIRGEVAAEIGQSSPPVESLPAALLWEMFSAQRRGRRTLVMNRVVISSTEERAVLYPVLDRTSSGLLATAQTAQRSFVEEPHQRRELLAAKARRPRPQSPIPVLLDCRGIPPLHNGTSECALGLLQGIAGEGPNWTVDVVFTEEAARYHRVAGRLSRVQVHSTLPDRSYASAVAFSQPLQLSTVAELHRRGLTLAFNVLDTVVWDAASLGSPGIAEASRCIAAHADGLLYNSALTRERFRFRFPVAPSVVELVTGQPLDSSEYQAPGAERSSEEDFLLVLGNRHDPKAVDPTVDLLSEAFPYQELRAIGGHAQHRPNVTTFQSDRLSDAELDRLVATARVVVFPSQYEGFGLSVVRALAYGRSIALRASSVWGETVDPARTPGRLVEYIAPHELIEAVGRFLAREPLEQPPHGAVPEVAAGLGWRDCARRLVGLVEEMVGNASPNRWYARECALNQAHLEACGS